MADSNQDTHKVGSTAIPDDLVLPFHADKADANGRIVRLGQSVNTILSRHNYPDQVSQILAEAVALTALLGTALKFDGKFILQTKTDGPINFLVVSFETPGKIRGYASYDEKRLTDENTSSHDMLGNGHMAMTIDQGSDMDRYQGIVALEGQTLEQAARAYFRQSEQLPTFIRLSVAKLYAKGEQDSASNWSWRAGGLLVQNLSPEGGNAPIEDEQTGEALDPIGSDDENWTRAKTLAETVESHELLDPLLPSERLLYRLFHEENVRVFDARPLEVYCSCSRKRVESLLDQFSPAELQDMVVDGDIVATCEFCNTEYRFDADTYL